MMSRLPRPNSLLQQARLHSPRPERVVTVGLEVVDRIIQPRRSVYEQQRRTLRQLLKKASRTQFGRHYDFAELLQSADPIKGFQQRVPLFTYEHLWQEWWQHTHAGAADVTWPGRVNLFALSSGTSNANTKYIPVTKRQIRVLNRSAVRMFTCLPNFTSADAYLRGWLAIGGTSHLQQDGTRHLGYLSGINANKQPSWVKGFYKPGKQIAEITDFDERLSAIAEQAPNWDIGVLIGIPHWVQLTLEAIIQRHQLQDIREIWPHLSLFISGGTSNLPYRPILNRLCGHELAYLDTYLASEGMLGFQTSAADAGVQLLLNNGIFFEFIPFDEVHFDSEGELRPGVTPLSIGEVSVGCDYALAISTCAGAWRYLIGDTVRFLDLARGEVVISGRTKYYINLCTEHLTVDNMNAGIKAVEQALGIIIPEFTVSGITIGDQHLHRWYIGTDSAVDTAVLQQLLDTHLGLINDDYRSERQTALGIAVQVVPVRYFYEWQRRTHRATGQSKVPRVLRGDAWQEWEATVAQLRSES